MDTPRARSPCLLPPLSSKPTAPFPPQRPPLSAGASPSHDFSFLFASAYSSPLGGGHLPPLSMSRAPIGRVVSDLSHNNSFSTSSKSNASRHQTTTSKQDDRDQQAKNRASAFISSLGGAWRKESGSSDKKLSEEKRNEKAKSATGSVGQWVRKYMTAVVDHLRPSFYRGQQRRRRPHSFSGHGPNAARQTKERERWARQQLSSAPASLRMSPANSGHLSVGRSVKVSSEESTMVELQSAVEAAIAHCKNSISRARADE